MSKKRRNGRTDAGASPAKGGSRATGPAAHPAEAGSRGTAARSRLRGLVVAGAACLVLIAVAFVGLQYWPRQGAWRVERRIDQNVLLITIDTLRADALGCYGGGAATPNLDGLAAAGARFDFAH